MSTLNDALLAKLSAFDGTYNERQMAWLISMLAVAPDSNAALDDLWAQFLAQEGYSSGTTQENMTAYMAAIIGGSPAGTTNDIQLHFWLGTLPPDEDFRLTEAGYTRVTEDGAYRELEA